MRFHSKKDMMVIVPLWVGLLLPFLIGISYLFNPDIPKGISWLVLCIGIVVSALVLALIYPMYYEISPTTLLVRSGSIRVNIPLDSIQQVFPERYARSSPALSLDRVRVEYRKHGVTTSVHISPQDKFRFMQVLTEYAEGLEVKDGRVVRRQ